ncbi:unnamed protein product [Paramecium octaurelia]|uniref:Uncharacterized protein n=1 Tax=Paramecium octaurelia TaxID=43137 RepID=A0A8S1YE49_PAROT|nr:unnamed protein product [Paramecium octaurelia]
MKHILTSNFSQNSSKLFQLYIDQYKFEAEVNGKLLKFQHMNSDGRKQRYYRRLKNMKLPKLIEITFFKQVYERRQQIVGIQDRKGLDVIGIVTKLITQLSITQAKQKFLGKYTIESDRLIRV